MVLTQPARAESCGGSLCVSIPLWFLRNVELEEPNSNNSPQFPYHYGSYATAILHLQYEVHFSFHTTMVLTQP